MNKDEMRRKKLNLQSISLLYIVLSLLFRVASAETITRPNLLASEEPFNPGGVVEMSETKTARDVIVLKTETGNVNGVNYHFYYEDGSGSFSGAKGNDLSRKDAMGTNWTVECEKDAITDKKTCSMHLNDLWIYVSSNGKTTVSIGHAHFPGSSVTIRIDQSSPIGTSTVHNGDFSASTSYIIITRLKNAHVITTRYMKWPDRSWVDEKWDLYGFNETFKYINWAVKHIK